MLREERPSACHRSGSAEHEPTQLREGRRETLALDRDGAEPGRAGTIQQLIAAVASHAASLPGVQACLITGSRGTARAGQFPVGLNSEVLGALALEISGKIAESAARLNVGRVESTTVHRDDCAFAIFAHEGVWLSVVLGPRGFVAGVRQRLARAAELLAGVPPAS